MRTTYFFCSEIHEMNHKSSNPTNGERAKVLQLFNSLPVQGFYNSFPYEGAKRLIYINAFIFLFVVESNNDWQLP